MQKSPGGPSVAADGFPTGKSTPEGAACDLARAFIQSDPKRFDAACLRPYGPREYEQFLTAVRQKLLRDSRLPKPSPMAPRRIETVYAARTLSRNGPNSYADAVMGLKAIRFVDVEVSLHGGRRAINRTFVVQTPDGRWFVHPAPQLSPLLSDGLNQEPPSTDVWKKL